MLNTVFATRRPRAVAVHFAASALVAAFVAVLVFQVWYPKPYAAIAGGPLLTGVVASTGKPLREFRRDLTGIVLLQAAGLGYGLYPMAMARPVYVSFEVDRFRVVTAADVDAASLVDAPLALRALPWTGPQQIAAVKPTNPDELMRSVDLGLAGFDLSMMPRNWREYPTQIDAVWHAAKPATALLEKYPQMAPRIAELAAAAGQELSALRYLPLVSRQSSWVALVAMPSARIVGQLALDGF